MRFLIPLVAWLCTMSACSLLFGSEDEDTGLSTDGGITVDAAVGTPDAAVGTPDAAVGTPDAEVGDPIPRVVGSALVANFCCGDPEPPYRLSGLSGTGNNNKLVVFIVTQGAVPESVTTFNGNVEIGGRLASNAVEPQSPTIFVYVVQNPPFGPFDVVVGFDTPQTSTIAAVLVEGAIGAVDASLTPGNPTPTIASPIPDNQLLLYSVVCPGTVTWDSETRRLWFGGVAQIYSVTGLSALAKEPLDPLLSGVGACGATAAAGVLLTGSTP